MSASNQEIEIPVPWGKISGKTWGKESYSPILVLHGILDNCGSFDRLIPLLPNSFYYVCIDLPGHGRSSHFPSGIPLEFMNYVYSVKLVIDYLKWEKFIIMGHSLGAQITGFFCSLYPEMLERVILIDGVSPRVINVQRSLSHLKGTYNRLQAQEKTLSSRKPPSYTYDEALKRIISSRKTFLTNEAAEILIKRAVVPSDDGYKFSIDQRLKLSLRPMLTMKQMKSILDHMTCRSLMIIAKDTYKLLDSVSDELYHERLRAFFINKINFSFFIVEGNHDVHLNYPERLAPTIIPFLLEPNKSSL